MLKTLLVSILSIPAMCFAQTETTGYAITDIQHHGRTWVALRKVDFRSGNFSDILFNGADRTNALRYLKGVNREAPVTLAENIDPALPFSNGVAAMAYDRISNRIFFVPMFVDQLRYIDLNSMQVFTAGDGFGHSRGKNIAESLSRMVIAGDGHGYTLTGDGRHLYRFRTMGAPVIEDLGPLHDLTGNSLSILDNPCATAGGDMIADDNGNLYLVSAYNHVFRISVKDMEADYLGTISGMPNDYTTNGAAVDHEGQILVTSSIKPDLMFKVDPLTWKAAPFKGQGNVFNASDLGSSNLLVTGLAKKDKAFISSAKGAVKIFPNPVRSGSFTVGFSNMRPGSYELHMTDVSGRVVLRKKIRINTSSFSENVELPVIAAKGMHLVKLVSEDKKRVTIQKLFIESTY